MIQKHRFGQQKNSRCKKLSEWVDGKVLSDLKYEQLDILDDLKVLNEEKKQLNLKEKNKILTKEDEERKFAIKITY